MCKAFDGRSILCAGKYLCIVLGNVMSSYQYSNRLMITFPCTLYSMYLSYGSSASHTHTYDKGTHKLIGLSVLITSVEESMMF